VHHKNPVRDFYYRNLDVRSCVCSKNPAKVSVLSVLSVLSVCLSVQW